MIPAGDHKPFFVPPPARIRPPGAFSATRLRKSPRKTSGIPAQEESVYPGIKRTTVYVESPTNNETEVITTSKKNFKAAAAAKNAPAANQKSAAGSKNTSAKSA